VLRFANQPASDGIQTRLAAPGSRTRATCTRTATAHHQITPGHSPEIHPTYETEHPWQKS
jgi:hypothetical protein